MSSTGTYIHPHTQPIHNKNLLKYSSALEAVQNMTIINVDIFHLTVQRVE